MPLLSEHDPLPRHPRRVLVAGNTGSGKTTLATIISRAWDLPRFELDALHHGAGWQPRPSFVDDVAAFAGQARWVTEWQYTRLLGDTLSGRADLVLWLDHPRHLVMRQVIARTVRRRWRREILWNGNTEGPLHTFFTDPEHIIRWAWRTHGQPGERVRGLLAARPDSLVVRLRGRRAVTAWIRRHTT